MGNFTFADLRILAIAAYDFLMENHPKDCALTVGGIFYPTVLENDKRRLGGLISLSIKSLDDHFKQRELFGGPALADETRRLLVADVVASAHLQARDLGYLHKIIKAWYPDDAPDRYKDPKSIKAPTMFSLEKHLGVPIGDKVRNTYSTLYAVIHGTIWLKEADQGADDPAGVSALQNALYAFSEAMDPIFKEEVSMKGVG